MYDQFSGRWMPDMPASPRQYNLPRIEVIEVNGMRGAEALQLGPMSRTLVLDQNEPVCFVIQTDGAGVKTVQAYDLTPHIDVAQQQAMNIEQKLTALAEKITRLEEKLNEPTIRHEQQSNPVGTDELSKIRLEGAESADGT